MKNNVEHTFALLHESPPPPFNPAYRPDAAAISARAHELTRRFIPATADPSPLRQAAYQGAYTAIYRQLASHCPLGWCDTDAGEIAALATTGPEESAIADRLDEILGGRL